MSQPLDIAGDLGHTDLHKYLTVYPLPERVKAACQDPDQLVKLASPDKPSDRVYADPRHPRQFPIHTADATCLSYAYFLDKQSQLSPSSRKQVQERLDKAAAWWGVADDVSKLREKQAELDLRQDLPDSCYAMVGGREDGFKERHYRISNAEEVKAAADWFSEYLPELREQFDWHDRQKIAHKILSKAAELNVSLGDRREMLEKAAGQGLSKPAAVARAIRSRTYAVRNLDEKVKQAMLQLSETVEGTASAMINRELINKLASQLDNFDRNHGLLSRYDDSLPAPEEALFHHTFSKTASAVQSCCGLINGTVYDQDDFAKLAYDDLKDLFGPEFARQSLRGLKVDPEKVAELASTLPRPDADMFEDLMNSKGARPLTKSASGCGFSREDLLALAGSPL